MFKRILLTVKSDCIDRQHCSTLVVFRLRNAVRKEVNIS
jgi:hypothetical protein